MVLTQFAVKLRSALEKTDKTAGFIRPVLKLWWTGARREIDEKTEKSGTSLIYGDSFLHPDLIKIIGRLSFENQLAGRTS